MAQAFEYKDIFSTPIWCADLDPERAAAVNARLMAEIEALASPRPALPPGANWQTDPTIHLLPQFAEFVAMVERHGQAVAKFLQLEATELKMSGCWANINPPGGRNSTHSHPNNFLSGTYYVSLPGDVSHITFEDPRPQAHVMMPPRVAHNAYNSNVVTFEVRPGRLVIFPAWLNHSVPINRTPHDRVSIAFNLMFPDYVTQASPALWRGTVPVAQP
jgi:uncharacterized protein (TIGR02466 family)